MTVRIVFDTKKTKSKLKRGAKNSSERVIKSVQYAAERVRQDILVDGRKDIAAGGNFSSSRWQDGFQVKKSYKSRVNIVLRVTHAVRYWRVFEYGARIRGRPLLWIPLSFARDAIGVLARNFPGGLFRVNRKGGKAPLLLSRETGEVKYFGRESVRIPKKWHLKRVVYQRSRRLNRYFREAMKNGK